MPTKKRKKFNARFPPARIKKIMQSDEEVGKVAAAVPVIISRALELFVESLLTKVNSNLASRGARTMTPGHLKMSIVSEPRFDFLKDLVSEVPDLPGDSDDLDLASRLRDDSVSRPQPRIQRQISSSDRPRGRPKKIKYSDDMGDLEEDKSDDDSNSNGRLASSTKNQSMLNRVHSVPTTSTLDLETNSKTGVTDSPAPTLHHSFSLTNGGIAPCFKMTLPLSMATLTTPSANGHSQLAFTTSTATSASDVVLKSCLVEVDEDYDA